MKEHLPSLISILSVLSTASVSAAETAYVRPGDVIVCAGDSVTHAGVYDGFLQAMLDLNSREGQPCDAVEFILDQRPVNAIGRPTANADANPEGIVRIGVCFVVENGKPVARVLSLPELPAGALSERDPGVLYRVGY